VTTYEGLFILKSELQGEHLEKEMDFIKNEIVKQRGEIAEAKLLGRRRLAYPVKKMKEGLYLLVNFASQPDVIDKFLKRLALNANVLRSGVFLKGKGSQLNEIRD
jgi:small subunit ribosomal protein S6